MRYNTYEMKKLFAYLIICLFVYWIIPAPSALAAGEFTADYNVEYTIAQDGKTIVTQAIGLTNKLTNLYPTKYSILIDSLKIRDVVASDRKGTIKPIITQKDGKTEITLEFNDQVVGIGKTLHFTLRFINDDIAVKNGSIWEINIPGIRPDPDIGSYFVSLLVPSSFGPNAYTSPLPQAATRWNKEQMTKGGVSAAYGQMQAFSLNLAYFLQNTGIAPTTDVISLPPDTAFQKVVLRSLDPKPKRIYEDEDGNWLAEYSLGPGKKLDIAAAITVFITSVPRKEFGKQLINTITYTRSLKYWETNDPKIAELGQKLRTPKEIYDYVVQTLAYDYNRVNTIPTRKGAIGALATPQNSICMEFTDLFVAIARAAGIPAREVVGFAYTTNATLRPLSLVADVLHAWPEYFDSSRGIWVGIDPTWEKTTGGVDYFTKLDFDHIAFAIHGLDSATPYPAGFYKRPGESSKDVLVSFADIKLEIPPSPSLTTTFTFPAFLASGLTNQGNLIIKNTGTVASGTIDISVSAPDISFAFTKQIPPIPPLGNSTIPLKLTVANYLLFGTISVQATVNGEVTKTNVRVAPTPMLIIPLGIALILIIGGLWILARR